MPGCRLPSGINRCVEEMEKVEIELGKLALILVGLAGGGGGCHLLKRPWASAM